MPQPQPEQIPFPAAGLNEDAGYDTQPPLTTTEIINVRAHDSLKDRIRGGRRPGLAKFHTAAINSSAAIQHLLKVVEPTAYPTISQELLIGKVATTGNDLARVSATGTVTEADGVGDDVNGIAHDGSHFYIATEGFTIIGHDSGNRNSVFKYATDLTDPNIVWSWDAGGIGIAECLRLDTINDRLYVGAQRADDWEGASSNFASVWAFDPATGSVTWFADLGTTVIDVRYNEANDTLICLCDTATSTWTGATKDASVFILDASDGSILYAWDHGGTGFSTFHKFDVRADGTVIVGHRTGNTAWEGNDSTEKNVWVLDTTLTVTSSYLLEEFGNSLDAVQVKWIGDDGDFLYVGRDTGTAGSVKRYDSTGTQVWSFNPGDDAIEIAITSPLGQVAVLVPPNSSYTGAGSTAELFLLNAESGDLENAAEIGASLHDGDPLVMEATEFSGGPLSTRSASLIVVAGGTVKKIEQGVLTTATGGTSALTTEPYRVNGVQAFSQLFYVDGTNAKYYDLATDTVATWTASSAGTLPSGARLIARYRGRLVLSGIVSDPSNWFMSKVGDPFDWDYAPATVTVIQAVAGNASEVGLVGDVVTALMPFSDDAMLIGGDQSIWQMSGDPAAGGSIDLVTDKVGVAWNAWTQDPAGAIYFLGVDGVYRIEKNQLPIKITENKLDRRFKDIDLSSVRCLMAWDLLRQGLVLTLATPGTSSQTSYFWDSRTDGWSVDRYPSSMGPSFVYAYDSEDADDTKFLLGCKDSYIREVSPTASDDDGTTMTASVRYAPIALTDGRTNGILQAVDVILANGSGAATLKVYTGQTAEECALSTTPRYARTLDAGRNAIASHNIRGRFVQIELSGSAVWAVESVFVTARKSGTGRHKRGG